MWNYVSDILNNVSDSQIQKTIFQIWLYNSDYSWFICYRLFLNLNVGDKLFQLGCFVENAVENINASLSKCEHSFQSPLFKF